MARIECWANIHNKLEREMVLKWISSAGFKSYHQDGPKVSVVYEDDPNDPDQSGKRWATINFFESYPEHGIYGVNI